MVSQRWTAQVDIHGRGMYQSHPMGCTGMGQGQGGTEGPEPALSPPPERRNSPKAWVFLTPFPHGVPWQGEMPCQGRAAGMARRNRRSIGYGRAQGQGCLQRTRDPKQCHMSPSNTSAVPAPVPLCQSDMELSSDAASSLPGKPVPQHGVRRGPSPLPQMLPGCRAGEPPFLLCRHAPCPAPAETAAGVPCDGAAPVPDILPWHTGATAPRQAPTSRGAGAACIAPSGSGSGTGAAGPWLGGDGLTPCHTTHSHHCLVAHCLCIAGKSCCWGHRHPDISSFPPKTCLARASHPGAVLERLQFGAGEPGPMAGRDSRARGIAMHTLLPPRIPQYPGHGCSPSPARARAPGGARRC